ncbi:hypothetical protein E3N88_14078 [Mikania micrantha]|uniref:Uncharacterized protein n=1 Tax=Mikania micrantha TaxID=192012 RepID=A0A5N6P1P5_9ASTR|nr:hypothetical protein E3N88_14078 [Mikania micrantha]
MKEIPQAVVIVVLKRRPSPKNTFSTPLSPMGFHLCKDVSRIKVDLFVEALISVTDVNQHHPKAISELSNYVANIGFNQHGTMDIYCSLPNLIQNHVGQPRSTTKFGKEFFYVDAT